jgi:hypothetical protein
MDLHPIVEDEQTDGSLHRVVAVRDRVDDRLAQHGFRQLRIPLGLETADPVRDR